MEHVVLFRGGLYLLVGIQVKLMWSASKQCNGDVGWALSNRLQHKIKTVSVGTVETLLWTQENSEHFTMSRQFGNFNEHQQHDATEG